MPLDAGHSPKNNRPWLKCIVSNWPGTIQVDILPSGSTTKTSSIYRSKKMSLLCSTVNKWIMWKTRDLLFHTPCSSRTSSLLASSWQQDCAKSSGPYIATQSNAIRCHQQRPPRPANSHSWLQNLSTALLFFLVLSTLFFGGGPDRFLLLFLLLCIIIWTPFRLRNRLNFGLLQLTWLGSSLSLGLGLGLGLRLHCPGNERLGMLGFHRRAGFNI